MAEDQIVGTAKNAVGKIQDAAGALLGDTSQQVEGKGRQLAGKVQAQYGETVDQVVDATKSNPIAALLIAAGVGLLLGKLM
ncbi:MAG: CsbD family protein [Janthinobacterium lividum]